MMDEQERLDWEFGFVVEDLTKEEAGMLLDLVQSAVELAGRRMGGGYWVVEDAGGEDAAGEGGQGGEDDGA